MVNFDWVSWTAHCLYWHRDCCVVLALPWTLIVVRAPHYNSAWPGLGSTPKVPPGFHQPDRCMGTKIQARRCQLAGSPAAHLRGSH